MRCACECGAIVGEGEGGECDGGGGGNDGGSGGTTDPFWLGFLSLKPYSMFLGRMVGRVSWWAHAGCRQLEDRWFLKEVCH